MRDNSLPQMLMPGASTKTEEGCAVNADNDLRNFLIKEAGLKVWEARYVSCAVICDTLSGPAPDRENFFTPTGVRMYSREFIAEMLAS